MKGLASVEIRQATNPQEITQVEGLFRQYFDWLVSEFKIDMNYQGIEAELVGLPGYFAPPAGRLLIMYDEGLPAGCGAFRPLEPRVCELNRMFVRPEFRGRGFGRAMALRLLDEARLCGYSIARLDTASFLKEAPALYLSLGFQVTGPYYQVPEDVLK